MLNYIIRRLAYTGLVMLGVAFMVFMVIHLIPGDPVQIMLGEDYSQEAYEAWRDLLGLNDPLHIQFATYVAGIVRGDFGTSFRTRTDVLPLILSSLGPTLQLAFAALVVTVFIGVPAGVFSAIRRNTVWDKTVMSLSVLGVSAPTFWVGMLLLYVFALQLRWFPPFGANAGLRSIVLPAITLGLNYGSMVARISRSNMLDVLSQDYVRTATAKGVHPRDVNYKHALKNAALPIVTIIGLQVGFLISGSLIVETVFAWPGMGRLVIVSVTARDIPTVQGIVLLMGLFISLVNLAVDLLYGVLDPRVKFS